MSLGKEFKNCGKKIVTDTGNILFCVVLFAKPFYGVMDPDGKRVCFLHETKRGNYLTVQQWDYALEKWVDKRGQKVAVQPLSSDELTAANLLALRMALDFTHGMSAEQKEGLPPEFRRSLRKPQQKVMAR